MFTLKSVTLRNFRLVNDATFKPLEEGITGIAGENGTGKSSFLAGVLWALFDIRPPDVPVSGLRRQGTAVSEECFVAVVFEHDGQEIEVIRELRGKSNRAVVNIYVDGIEQTHTSVKVANAWVKNRLKIDANAFTTAFVVRQKELDALVRARPAERRATIERLSGIEKMSSALKLAREEENEKRREVKALPGDEETENTLRENVEHQESVVTESEHELKAAKTELEQDSQSAESNRELLAAVEQYLRKTSELRQGIEATRYRLTSLEERIADQKKNAEPATAEDAEKAHALYAEIKHEHEKVTAEYNEAVSMRRGLDSDLSHARKTMQSEKETIARLSAQQTELGKSTNVDTAKTAYEEKAQEHVSLETVESDIVARGAALRSQLDAAELALKSLNNTATDDTSCPTCHSVLDDPAVLIAAFESQKETLAKDIVSATQEYNETKAKKNSVKNELEQLSSTIQQSEQALRDLSRVTNELSAAQERLETVQTTIRELEQRVESVDAELADTVTRGKALGARLEEAQRALSLAQNGLKTNDAIAALETEREQQRQTLQTQNDELSEYTQGTVQQNTEMTDARQDELRELVAQDTHRLQLKQQNVSAMETNLRVNEERLESLRRDHKREQDLLGRKKASLAMLASRSAVSDVLDEFRKDRIARIAPELSETATSLISAMTSGRYTEVLLDENFTPSLVDSDGHVRSAAWLSGGEESALALALLIAIGDLLTGGLGGLLWLDEVLTAQDTSRRASLIDTLRNIPGRQVVMINHTPDSMDMVDKIVHIVPTEDGSFMEDDS